MRSPPIRASRSGIWSILIAACLTTAASPERATGPATAADSLRETTEKLFVAGLYDSLVQVASEFARRAEATGDSVLLGRALTQRGRTLLMLRQPGAERDIDAAIRVAESVHDTTGLMPAVGFKGFFHWGAGRTDDAIRCFERRRSLAVLARSPLDEAWAHTSLGYSFHNLGDQQRAKAEYERALDLCRAADNKVLEINVLIGLGRVESGLGDGPASIRWYRGALALAIETGDRMNEMWAANNLAVMETKQGDLSRAWEYLQHATALARELGSPYGMTVPAFNLATALEELGDFETAQSVLEEMRTLCETHGATDLLPTCDFQLGLLRLEQGRYASAIATLRPLTRKPASLEAQHRDLVFVLLAQALASSDSVEAAIRVLSGHLNTPGRTLYGDTTPGAYLELGHLYADAGDPRTALVYARRAHQVAIPAAQKRTIVASMFLESACCRLAGDRSKAAAVFQAALDSLDAARGGIGTPEWREVYGQHVSQDVVEAGRILLEYPESSSPALRERAFFDAIQRVKTRALIDRISRPHRETGDVDTPLSNQVATLADVQSRLQAGESVLDFCVGTRHSFLAAVTRDSLRVVELPGPKSPLDERIRLLRSVVASTDPSLRADYDAERLAGVQRTLGREILGDVANMVERSTRVFISPDGFFSAVPFGLLILRDDGAVLMQDRDVVQVPSTSVLVMERSGAVDTPRERRIVAISASSHGLSGARHEVKELARRYRHVDRFADLEDADAFAQAVSNGEALHIASHALVVDRAPWWSGIQLRETNPDSARSTRSTATQAAGERRAFFTHADSLSFPSDPYLRAWQIARLDIPAELAVLSACETAGGRMTTGEGTLGLTAAFLSAGVPVVVSSLWPVDDRVTAIIMRSFYRHLAAGQTIASALRLAQLETSRASRYSHPFYWSGFTVVGDGARTIPIERRSWFWNPMLAALAGAGLLTIIAILTRRRRTAPIVG